MSMKHKRWTHIGLSAAMVGTAFLAGCGEGGESGEAGEGGEHAVTESAELGGEGEGTSTALGGEGEGEGEGSSSPAGLSEGGEGEGGVAIDAAASDPVVFVSALAITEAHIVAARDAAAEGETDAAAEMFAHPVSEVLFDMEDILVAQGVTLFDDKLIAASQAVLAGESNDEIAARTDEIIAALRAAATHAPDNGTSAAMVNAGVAADQIKRAAHMYTVAGESDEYEPYLDGYGFVKAAEAHFALSKSDIEAANADAASAIQSALVELSAAYPTATRPAELPGDASKLTAASSNIALALQ